MKVLMISTDRKIFETKSSVRRRILEYGTLTEELHIIVFSKRGADFREQKIGGNVYVYPTNSKNRWWYIFDAVGLAKRVSKKHNLKGKSNLVSTQDPFEAGLAGLIVARAIGARLQIQIHTDFLSEYFIKDSFLNKIRVYLARLTIPRADCIRVVSKRIKKSIIEKYKIPETKITTLPIFVDVEKIKNSEINMNLREKYPQFDFIILMASRFSEEKNIPLALRAVSSVIKKYPKTGLIIVGDEPKDSNFKSLYEKKAVELNLSKNIIFEGWQKDTISYHKTTDLFLNTSNYEGYGMSLIEAIASDTAIVTTNVGIVGEILTKNNAFICEVGDTRCITRNTMNAIENKSVCKELARSATYAISNIPRKNVYLELYKKNWEDCV